MSVDIDAIVVQHLPDKHQRLCSYERRLYVLRSMIVTRKC